ncbi:SIR2 family protein [Macellibacteroides fermentans]|uniref:SIR2 family protein n=1 Tax=Macellibacteroides fermentans TaxID=879969 RepID=UPI003B93A9C6
MMGIERLTTLAFSMYTNKAAYALLLGAGISRSSHIPSGWEVENLLIEQLAAIQGVADIEDWHQWYKDKYGNSATYSSLLEELVKEPTERVQLMRGFFEPTDEEKELGWKKPTKAHEAIAKLAKDGYIRVILTTNFDRLLERALEAEDIIPQVICHVSDIEKSTPIVHGKTITIIKINGDYIDCRFRNTTDELDNYPEAMKNYISRIFEDYGLITCGWSATWDKGLVDIINASSSSRYNSFFTNVGEANGIMKALAASRRGEIMLIKGADNLFTELHEQVEALEKSNTSRRLNYDVLMSRVKKYLSSELYNIDYSDLIEKFCTEAYDKIMAKANYNFTITPEQFSAYFELHHNAVKPLIDIAILAARWGKAYHIEAFGDIIVKLCTKPFRSGEITTEGTQYLHALGATLLVNAVGIACVKYERFTELNKILKLSVPAENFMGFHRGSLLYLLGSTHWDYNTLNHLAGTNSFYPWSFILIERLRSHFKGCFIVDSEYENTFYIWEHLKSLVYGYNQCYMSDFFYVPKGQFLLSRVEYKMRQNGEEPYSVFFDSADRMKGEWEPIKQGMFSGNYEEYKTILDKTEESFKRNNIY